MSSVSGLKLTQSAALKEKKLAALVARVGIEAAALAEIVEDAQILGSLELAGFDLGWDEVRRSRATRDESGPIAALRRARHVVDPKARFSVEALLAWHGAVIGAEGRLRSGERARDGGPPPAPAAFVVGRLRVLEEWLNVESARELKPAPAAALACARVVEIAPFEDANGRVARLAASHLMLRGGARPPILVGADRKRLVDALQAAFQLMTEPLAALLTEAAERSLDVMIQSLEPKAGG